MSDQFASLREVEANPAFKKLSYEDQLKVRSSWANDNLGLIPDFVNADPVTRQGMYDFVVNRSATFEDDNDPVIQQYKELYKRLRAGDPEAIEQAKGRIFNVESTRSSLIGNIVAGITSVMDGGTDYNKIYGKDGQKINAMLMSSLRNAMTPQDMARFQDGIGMASFGVNMAEAIVSGITLVGGLGKAGILTKGLLGPTGRVAKFAAGMPSGFAQKIVGELGEQAVQSVIMGVVSTAQNATMLAMQNPETKMEVGQLAATLGAEIAFDWLAWAGLTPAITAGKAIVRSMTGFGTNKAAQKLLTSMGVEEYTKAVNAVAMGQNLDPTTMSTIRAINEQAYEEAMISGKGFAASTRAAKDLSDPMNRAILATDTLGFILNKTDDGTYELRPRDNLSHIETFGTADEAVNFARANTGVAFSEFGIGKSTDLIFARDTHVVVPTDKVQSTQFLRRLIEPSTMAMRDNDNARFFVRNVVSSSGAVPQVGSYIEGVSVNQLVSGSRLDVDADFNAKKLSVYKTFDTPQAEQNYRKYLYRYAQKVAELDPNKSVLEAVNKQLDALNQEIASSRIINLQSLEAMRYVAQKELGIDFKTKNGQVYLNGVAFPSQKAAMAELYAGLVRNGKLDLASTQQIVNNLTGYNIVLAKGQLATGQKGEVYQLRDKAGNILVHAYSLDELIRTSPHITEALGGGAIPDTFGPTVWMTNAVDGTAVIRDGVAVGSVNNLLEMANNFFSIKKTGSRGLKMISSADGKSIAFDIQGGTFQVTDSKTGITYPFATAKEAKGWVQSQANTWGPLEKALLARNMYTVRGELGGVIAVDETGKTFNFRTMDEASKFIKEHPIPNTSGELIPVDPEAAQAMNDANMKAVGESLDNVSNVRKWWNNLLRSQTFSQIWLPVESHLEDVAMKSGNPAFLRSFREVQAALRLVNMKTLEQKTLLQGAFGKMELRDRQLVGIMIQTPESLWADAEAYTKTKITPAHKLAAEKLNAFYAAFRGSNSVVGDKALNYYQPKIKNWHAQQLAKGIEPPIDADTFLMQAFNGQVPDNLQAFAEKLRTSDFLTAMDETDPYKLAMQYVNQIHKKQYLGSTMTNVHNAFAEAKKLMDAGKMTAKDFVNFTDVMMEMFGHKTPTGVSLKEASIKRTTALYNTFFKKFASTDPLKKWELAEKIISDDLIGKLSSFFTISTQAGRMWAIPRNLTQTALIGAVTGNKRAWDALSYVVNHPEYINDLIHKGYLSDTLYANHDVSKGFKKNLIELSMNPLENTEIITRATAMRTAEMMAEDAVPRYRKGIINKIELINEMSADIVDKDMQVQLLNLIDGGQEKVAAEILGRKFIDITMFNYARGAGGSATRGTIGRLFGKLGVYPMGALSLYRDILTRGTPTRMIGRAARLMATTTALYAAFNSIGVDYRGFLWSDPFEFSGGPYWTMLNDLMESFGNSNDSAMARARFVNSATRVVIPSTFRYFADAAKYMQEGRPYEAMLAFMTMPMQKSLKEYGVFTPVSEMLTEPPRY